MRCPNPQRGPSVGGPGGSQPEGGEPPGPTQRSPSRASFLNARKAYAVSDKSAGHKEHSKQRTVWRTCCDGVFGVLRSFGGAGLVPCPKRRMGSQRGSACASHQSLADVSAKGSGRRGARASVARRQDPSHGGPQVPRRGHTGARRGCPGALLPPPEGRRCRQSSHRDAARGELRDVMRGTGPARATSTSGYDHWGAGLVPCPNVMRRHAP